MPENTAKRAKLCLRFLGRSAFECANLCQVHGSRGGKGGWGDFLHMALMLTILATSSHPPYRLI